MTKRRCFYNTIEGKAADRCPAGFWIHFPQDAIHGEAAVRAHMDFMAETDTDILKVMNENILYDGESKIRSSRDIGKFRGFSRKDKMFQDQMEIIKRICGRAGENTRFWLPSTDFWHLPSTRRDSQGISPAWDTAWRCSAGSDQGR